MSEPPFYVLPESQTDVSPSHNTSRAGCHHQSLAAFSEDVNRAAKRAFPNRGRSRYETVHVCLIRWEDDVLGVQPELINLEEVLRDYGFLTDIFLIPSLDSHWDLMRKTLDFIQARDGDQNLFVLYYAGHGRMNSARQAEWVLGQDPNSPFVDWSAIQGLFGAAKSDVLILLDTCAAASSATTSQFAVIETIAACGFERRAPPPGEYSLTTTLIHVLRDRINKPSFSAASLHTEILFQLKLKEAKRGREGIPLEWCVTPIYWINTKDCRASGIEICGRNVLPPPSAMPTIEADGRESPSSFIDAMEIDFNDTSSASTPLSSISPSGSYKVPHVLITLQLEENQPLDARQCARWLERVPLLAKWVKVEAVFPSYSTLMILSIPMPIWDMLPDHPACAFVGYVTAPNIGGLFMPKEVPTIEVPVVNDTSVQPRGSDITFPIRLSEISTTDHANERAKVPDHQGRSIFKARTLRILGLPQLLEIWCAARQTLHGHSGRVQAVTFSPDGKLLASASHDGTVRLWDATTGAALRTLEGHTGYVMVVTFSPDGKQLASASGDKTVRLWDIATGAAVQTLEGHTDWVRAIAFLPDGKQLASASDDKTVRLWDIATGAAVQTLEGHTGYIMVVTFSLDGKQLASASGDKTVRLWDVATGAAVQTLEGHTDWVRAIAFSPDGKQLASASGDKTVRLWDIATGAAVQTLEGHTDWVQAVAFSPDGKQLASASDDKTVRLWDIATGAAVQTLEGHTSWVQAVEFSPDGKQLASASDDWTVRLWDTMMGRRALDVKPFLHARV